MKKTVLGFIASFMVLSAHAQDMKIKKGAVLLNGTPVALLKEDKRTCELSTLDGQQVLTFSLPIRRNKASAHQKSGLSLYRLRAQSLNYLIRKIG